MQTLVKKFRENALVIISSAVILIAYAVIFGSYFPNADGGLGHDYKQQLPNLLAGYYWFLNNGLFSIPWFNPAQCGGVPFYADPGHGLYAIPQFLVLFLNPVLAVKTTFFLFALVGYVGFYLLLRRRFSVNSPLAVLGATLFLFNGFYAYRMIIGHPFHAFMLTPFLAFLLLGESSPPRFLAPLQNFQKSHTKHQLWPSKPASEVLSPNVNFVTGLAGKNIFTIAMAGAIIAYMFHSAMIHIIPPVILAVAIILIIHAYLNGWRNSVWLRFIAAGVMALGLASSKLVASLSFLANFPRDYYSLPGFSKLAEVVSMAFQSLFLRPPLEQAMRSITNSQWAIGRHELEFGVTPFPFIVFLIAAVFCFYRLARKQTIFIWSKRAIAYLSAIAALLLIPMALNFYAPGWNKFLKILPLIKNSSLLLRWFAAYIPVVILASVLSLNSWQKIKKHAAWIAAASIIFVIGYQLRENRTYYDEQKYDGRVINSAYERAKFSRAVVPIRGAAIYDPEEGPDPTRGQNDMMAAGFSQLACYNAIFGYRLEWFPLASLHPGPAFETAGGQLNVKNPACYVFPKENNCKPGDHFQASRRADAEKFLQYKPYPFAKSSLQKFADAVNIIFLLLLLFILVYPALSLAKKAVLPGRKR